VRHLHGCDGRTDQRPVRPLLLQDMLHPLSHNKISVSRVPEQDAGGDAGAESSSGGGDRRGTGVLQECGRCGRACCKALQASDASLGCRRTGRSGGGDPGVQMDWADGRLLGTHLRELRVGTGGVRAQWAERRPPSLSCTVCTPTEAAFEQELIHMKTTATDAPPRSSNIPSLVRVKVSFAKSSPLVHSIPQVVRGQI